MTKQRSSQECNNSDNYGNDDNNDYHSSCDYSYPGELADCTSGITSATVLCKS